MDQSGEFRIAADRATVWAALNDPEVLARCIDGCESMEKTAEDRFDARVKARVGPVRATFDAELHLEDVVPLQSYTISGNVKGGAAGFARGSARVDLAEEGDQTRLTYAMNANVGGKLAQVGSRLIDGAARKMADDFFTAFHRELGGGEAPSAEGSETPAPAAAAGAAPRAYESGGKWIIWLAAFVALMLALLFAF